MLKAASYSIERGAASQKKHKLNLPLLLRWKQLTYLAVIAH